MLSQRTGPRLQDRRNHRRDQLDARRFLRPHAGHHPALPPEPVGGPAPSALWGREAYARGLFGNHVSDIQTQRGQLEVTRFQTAQAVHDYFKNHYGPTIEAYANIGDNAVLAAELDAQLVELADQYLTDGVMEWEYLVLTGTKK
ncbi:hypothetical protein MMRN_22600 [Mycobacterium marinum]|nr:hypothetical protein MMRN_22600 [Mycobacterium marinum]